jgi:hypothetical protein
MGRAGAGNASEFEETNRAAVQVNTVCPEANSREAMVDDLKPLIS